MALLYGAALVINSRHPLDKVRGGVKCEHIIRGPGKEDGMAAGAMMLVWE